MDTTAIGAFARRSRAVTERDIALFTEITGDRNPIHYDRDLAAASRFGGLVFQGGLTSGLLNALVAEQLPGPGSVFLAVAWRFLAPVRPGDVITAEATVTSVRSDKPVTTLATRVTNQAGRHHGSRRHRRRVAGPGRGRRQQRCTAPPTRRALRHHRKGTTMSITTENPRTNGVDTAALFATLEAVKGQPEIAKFQFRATNTWLGGTHSRSRFSDFFGAMQELEHKHVTQVDSDHPAVLVGQDEAPSPVEYVLHAIAACLTAGIANVAAARGVELTKVSSTVEGDIDLLGILGLSGGSVRNGYQQIKVTFHIEGDADDTTLRAIVEQSRRRSAVYDVLTQPTPVSIEVTTG